jgi:hypothetical protein
MSLLYDVNFPPASCRCREKTSVSLSLTYFHPESRASNAVVPFSGVLNIFFSGVGTISRQTFLCFLTEHFGLNIKRHNLQPFLQIRSEVSPIHTFLSQERGFDT